MRSVKFVEVKKRKKNGLTEKKKDGFTLNSGKQNAYYANMIKYGHMLIIARFTVKVKRGKDFF